MSTRCHSGRVTGRLVVKRHTGPGPGADHVPGSWSGSGRSRLIGFDMAFSGSQVGACGRPVVAESVAPHPSGPPGPQIHTSASRWSRMQFCRKPPQPTTWCPRGLHGLNVSLPPEQRQATYRLLASGGVLEAPGQHVPCAPSKRTSHARRGLCCRYCTYALWLVRVCGGRHHESGSAKSKNHSWSRYFADPNLLDS